MERERSKSTSPVPVSVIRKSNSSASVLDDILRRKGRSSNASVGYGLADLYRNPPDLNPTSNNLAQICPPNYAQGAPPARARSPLVPVPLAKSVSAPLASLNDTWRLDAATAASAGFDPVAWERAPATFTEAENSWKCRGCDSVDPACLEPGSDGTTACRRCGTVSSSTMVPGERQKNGPREEDRTIVADAPIQDAHIGEMNALAEGTETSLQRRQRHIRSMGGTVIHHTAARKSGFANAQSRIDTEKARDAREMLEGDSRDAQKRRAIITAVAQAS